MPWSRVNTEYRLHRVQHTPSTASTQDGLSSVHSHDYELTPECSFSIRLAGIHNRPPSASSPWELRGKVTLSHSHSCELTNEWNTVSAPGALSIDRLQLPVQFRTITASMCISKLASKCISKLPQSETPSVSPNSLHYGVQVRTITASKCVSYSLDHGLQVYLQTCSITSSKFAWSPPPTASPTCSVTASKCIFKLARLWPPNSQDHGLQVHLQTGSITGSKCISKRARLSFSGAPRIALKHYLQPVQIFCV